jgi:hypothetical protein
MFIMHLKKDDLLEDGLCIEVHTAARR